MKIKQYLNKIVAIAAVVTLVSGFQISTADGSMATLESTIGIEEAYAGPCGDAGCDGKPGYCGTVTIIKIFKFRATKDCTGSSDAEGPAAFL